jgi:hypothetical protein
MFLKGPGSCDPALPLVLVFIIFVTLFGFNVPMIFSKFYCAMFSYSWYFVCLCDIGCSMTGTVAGGTAGAWSMWDRELFVGD